MNTIIAFPSLRKQRVILNGQVTQWTSTEAEVSQGYLLGPLLFFIYFNDLSDDLSTNDSFSATHLNNVLRKISNWVFQWEMIFDPDTSKQAQEAILSRKLQAINHLYFDNNPIKQVSIQKYLGMILNTKLNFNEHIKNILSKVNETFGLLRKLQSILPRASLLAILNRWSSLILITVMLCITIIIII